MSHLAARVDDVTWHQPSPTETALALAPVSSGLPPLAAADRPRPAPAPDAPAARPASVCRPAPDGLVGPLTKQDVMLLLLFALVLGLFFYLLHIHTQLQSTRELVQLLLAQALQKVR